MTAVERWEAGGVALRRSPNLASFLVGLAVAVFSPLAFVLLTFVWGHDAFGFGPSEAFLRSWAPTIVSLCLLWFITTSANRLRMALAVFVASGLASICYLVPGLSAGWGFIEIARIALLAMCLPLAFFEKADWPRIPAEKTFLFIFYFTLTGAALGALCGIFAASAVGAVIGFSPWGRPTGLGLGNWIALFVPGYAAGIAALTARCILFFETPGDVRTYSLV